MLSAIISSIPDENAQMELLQRFDKLLKKYAKMLDYEDSYYDLVLFFFELINKLRASDVSKKSDAVIVNYIVTSVKNQYIKISKELKAKKAILFSEMSEEQQHFLDTKLTYCREDDIEQYCPKDKPLTEWEYEVLNLIYNQGASVASIAKAKNKSRQSVNQAKLRALQKLRVSFVK